MAIIADAAGLHRTRAGHDDMGSLSRVIDKDEELGKRDDDYSRTAKSGASRWLPVRPRRRRLLLTCIFIGVVWMLFQLLPESETLKDTSNRILHPLGDATERSLGEILDEDLDLAPRSSSKKGKKGGAVSGEGHTYSGPIKFPLLSKSLHGISRTMGFRQWNNNVLFAGSNLRSLGALITMACEMRKYERNDAHVALFGRNNITIEELQELHGLTLENCDIYWHDARPDNAPFSTEKRAEGAVLAAFRNIETYMHPQVIITDDLEREDPFFARAVRRERIIHNHAVISIPQDKVQDLLWMSRLDVEPLREWHLPSVEIVIHTPPDSAGTLRRLMRNLEEADYAGLGYPKLTIEVPANVDSTTRRFLEQVRWPPRQQDPLSFSNMFRIRHRIPDTKISADEASFRFVESFYPTAPHHEHVLVLSASAQLSPLYYHYLRYAISMYKISERGSKNSHNILGIALELPSFLMDGSSRLKLPTKRELPSDSDLISTTVGGTKVPFMWEAPAGGAALYFGEKWAEIHSFITHRIASRENISAREKVVSPAFPSWMEFVLELSRSRGYGMLYPALPGDHTFATIHRESSDVPEEFKGKPMHDIFEPYLAPDHAPKRLREDRNEQSLLLGGRPLHELLLWDGDLPDPLDLPFLAYTGVNRSHGEAYDKAQEFAQALRREYGGCAHDMLFESGRKRKMEMGSASDLFCSGYETDEDYHAPPKPKVTAAAPKATQEPLSQPTADEQKPDPAPDLASGEGPPPQDPPASNDVKEGRGEPEKPDGAAPAGLPVQKGLK